MNDFRAVFEHVLRGRDTVDDGWAELDDWLSEDELDLLDARVPEYTSAEFIDELERVYDLEVGPLHEFLADQPLPLVLAWDHCLSAELQLIAARTTTNADLAQAALTAGNAQLEAAWAELGACLDQAPPAGCPAALRPFMLLDRLQERTEQLVADWAHAELGYVHERYDALAARVTNPLLAGLLRKEVAAIYQERFGADSSDLVRTATDQASGQRLKAALHNLRLALDAPEARAASSRIAAGLELAGLLVVDQPEQATRLLADASRRLAGLPDPDPGLYLLHARCEAIADQLQPLPGIEEFLAAELPDDPQWTSELLRAAVARLDSGRIEAALPLLREAHRRALSGTDADLRFETAGPLGAALAWSAECHEADRLLRGRTPHPSRTQAEPSVELLGDARVVALQGARAAQETRDQDAVYESVATAISYSERMATIAPMAATDTHDFIAAADALRTQTASTWTNLVHTHLSDLYAVAMPRSPLATELHERSTEEFVVTYAALRRMARDRVRRAEPHPSSQQILNRLDLLGAQASRRLTATQPGLCRSLLAATEASAIADLATEQLGRRRSAEPMERPWICTDDKSAPADVQALEEVRGQALFMVGDVLRTLGLTDPARAHLTRARDSFRASGNVIGEVESGFFAELLQRQDDSRRPEPGPQPGPQL